MNIEIYEREGVATYGLVAETISIILSELTQSFPDPGVQQIQKRAKDPGSLRKKLELRGLLESNTIEDEIKDLAGCRILFYTNADVRRFIISGVISDNFDVDWERTKFHYPLGNDDTNGLFISYNYVVRLNEARLQLPQFETYDNKWCEVQVQTALDHAWSAMAHDTIYKSGSTDFGLAAMKNVEKRMGVIMRNYLLPAGFDFQKIASDVQKLKRGRDLFAQNPLKLLDDCRTNDERIRIMNEYAEYVIPYLENRGKIAPEIIGCMVRVCEAARETPADLDSESESEHQQVLDRIIDKALEVIDGFRFSSEGSIDATFNAICKLFPGANSSRQRERLVQSAKSLSIHRINAWERIGPTIQHILVTRIVELQPEEVKPIRPVLIEILKQTLGSDVRGTSESHDSVTFRQVAVQPSKHLRQIRGRSIGSLKELFATSQTDAERREILRSLFQATKLPQHPGWNDELLKMILVNSIEVVRFLGRVVGSQSFEFLQTIEDDLFRLYRGKRKLPPEFKAKDDIIKRQKHLIQTIIDVRDKINTTDLYVVYKTLVGHQSYFKQDWRREGFDLESRSKSRLQKIDGIIKRISSDALPKWRAIIFRCMQTKSDDGATFIYFQLFLERFGKAKPALLIRLVEELDDGLGPFLKSVFKGLEDGPFEQQKQKLIEKMLSEQRNLEGIAEYCTVSAQFNLALLERCLHVSIAAKNLRAVLYSLSCASRRYTETTEPLAQTLLMPGLRYLQTEGNSSWVDAIWPGTHDGSFLSPLNEEEVDEFLASMIALTEISTSAEDVLYSLALSWPTKVIDYFGERLRLGRDELGLQYEAVPYRFDRLNEKLSEDPAKLVESVRSWFLEDSRDFEYEGAAFIQHILKDFSTVEAALKALVTSGDERDLQFTLFILKQYEGQSFVHPLCQDVIEAAQGNEALLRKVSDVLDATGVVSGEFGRVEIMLKRREELGAWLEDSRATVRDFVTSHLRALDRQIAADQRRSNEEWELRKREYPDSDPSRG